MNEPQDTVRPTGRFLPPGGEDRPPETAGAESEPLDVWTIARRRVRKSRIRSRSTGSRRRGTQLARRCGKGGGR
jgi:hypothetical protein